MHFMHRSHDNLVKYAVPLRAESDSETRVHESSVWVFSLDVSWSCAPRRSLTFIDY